MLDKGGFDGRVGIGEGPSARKLLCFHIRPPRAFPATLLHPVNPLAAHLLHASVHTYKQRTNDFHHALRSVFYACITLLDLFAMVSRTTGTNVVEGLLLVGSLCELMLVEVSTT